MRYVLIITILAAFTFSGCASSDPKPVNLQSANANKPAAAKPADNFKRVSIAEAKAAYDAKTAVIVDVRAPEAWKSERIKDSLNSPLGTFEKDASSLPTDKQVIFYCSCPHEQSALAAAQKAEAAGMKNFAVLVGGTQGWKDAGYPMDGDAPAPNATDSNSKLNKTGEKPMSPDNKATQKK
jgi:rhodanese-related sulfurtransferase